MSPLIFTSSSGWRIKVDAGVLVRLLGFAQVAPADQEAGGVLLGREIIGTGDYVVDDLTTPMRGDRRGRTWFFRSAALHQREISRAWRASDRTINYLGEWHTHPECRPRPSFVDRCDWRRRLQCDRVDGRYAVFLILGTEEVAGWLGDREAPWGRFELLGRHDVRSILPVRGT